MYVHEEAKLCFLANPRAASRAIGHEIAQQKIGFKQVGEHHDGPEQGYDISEYTTFCVVRNHWDTVVSWWYNIRMHKQEFVPSLEWMAGHFSKNRGYFWPGRLHQFTKFENVLCLRYENLDEEINTLFRKFGVPEVELVWFGESEERRDENGERRHYSTYYDSHTRAFVNWCFLPEITRLGYGFEEDPPWHSEARGRIVQMAKKTKSSPLVELLAERRKPLVFLDHGPVELALDAFIVDPPDDDDAGV